MNMMMEVLSCSNLHKSYVQGENVLEILAGINLVVKAHEIVSITGSSGSGKSTLLHVLAGLDVATQGVVSINGVALNNLTDEQITKIRNRQLGFVYQFHHLLGEFTAIENVLMPVLIRGNVSAQDMEYAQHLLNCLGLEKRVNHFPGQLSGGERQRVAIARAVINQPQLIFADEPTGNLDNYTSNQVLDIFFKLQEELHTSVIIVTHDKEIASRAHTCYQLHNGLLQVSQHNLN